MDRLFPAIVIFLSVMPATVLLEASATQRKNTIYSRENLVAWCIVPFDAKKRNPEERAEMMARLGIRQFAYDWRDEHLPQLDREIDALKKNRIRMTAIWLPSGLEPEKEPHILRILEVLKRRKLKPQLWVSMQVPEGGTSQQQRVELAARAVGWLADEAKQIGSKVALYNHGGWFGEPENQIEIIQAAGRKNVGIVYNFHHGHHRMEGFRGLFSIMKPYLLALNVNGMRKEGPKILSVGEGDREAEMLKIVGESGWRGPIGILGHREEMDAEDALRENLDGLQSIAGALAGR